MKNLRIWMFFGLSALASCKEPGPLPETPDSPVRSPEEEILSFQIDRGLEVQLVAQEPLVESPVIIQFDQWGRLWVVEMRGYMNDLEGSEEHQRVGRIAILEDQDGDGEMDHRITYLDSLIMPRALGLFGNGALIAENNSLWITEDLDGDWKADRKVLLDSTYAANGIPEHSDNGFLRNLDNWYYSAKSRIRYKLVNREWIRDSTEFRGQWGISQDDQGRLIYNYNWSQLHGDLLPPNSIGRNENHQPSSGIDYGLTIDRRVYPIRSNPAVNRGYIPGTLDSAKRLLEFTSASAPTVYRSSLLPQEYHGNMFVMENAGNLIKRNVVTENGIYLEAKDPNPGREFMASTDERFRPVFATVGPDGGLYIADMYQGIVQHGSYMTDYLKEQTLNRKLDHPGHMGRIWRIVPKRTSFRSPEKLGGLPVEELIPYLEHSDGWYRDMAQRLLVESGQKNLASQLENFISSQAKTDLGKIHALWTLEGLQVLNPEFLLEVLEKADYAVKTHVLRLLEPFAEKNFEIASTLAEVIQNNLNQASPRFKLQVALSSYVFDPGDQMKILTSVLNEFEEDPVFRDAILSSLQGQEYEFLSYLGDSEWSETEGQEKAIFLEMLTSAIVQGGDLVEVQSLVAQIEKASNHWTSKAILSGLATQGGNPDNLGKFTLNGQPLLFGDNNPISDNSALARAKNLFKWDGFSPEKSKEGALALDENSQKLFTEGRQKYLASCAGCHGGNGAGVNRMGPPLNGSEWVIGDERRLALILLHGIEGPISVKGKLYDAPEILPVMPSHSTMDDRSIAAILTYIRNEWGNHAGPIPPRLVGGTRHTSQGRVYPWSETELNAHIAKLNQTDSNP
ncbi:DUF7133 domain-containing protein [Algoriphagus limi]|uniref:C-type cytochrome n=1 Tax=Algoriphagus limi TaxID=2975273 RepID=A0ABT2G805_9BACT|nr:c-type cytochrome [Algoriphagus limi]